MKLNLLLVLGLLCSPAAAHAQFNDAARRLSATIDAMDVEHHWPAGEHVNWETGSPDGRPEKTEGRHTHCSAFVAAAAKRLGIYILRPPDHGQILLANAQYDWLSSGDARGWHAVGDGWEAQQRANSGTFVVAVYKSHYDNKPGHIAIVRPAIKSRSAVERDGPEIAQAGTVNYSSTTLRHGFAGHPLAWSRGEVRYYAHELGR